MRFPWHGEYLSSCRVGLVFLVAIEAPAIGGPAYSRYNLQPSHTPNGQLLLSLCQSGVPVLPLPSSTSPGCSTSSTVESRRSHCMRPFVESHRPRSKTVRCVNTRGCFEAGAGYVFRFISAARVVDHRTRGTAGTTRVLMRWQVLFYILYICRRLKNIGVLLLKFFGRSPIV